MYAIKDQGDGTYYTSDKRKNRKFGVIGDAHLFRTLRKAKEAIEDSWHPAYHAWRVLIVVEIELVATAIAWTNEIDVTDV